MTPQEALSRSNALHQSERVEFSEPNLIQIIPERPEIRGAAEDQPAGTLGTPLAPAPSSTTPTDTLYSNQWGLNNAGTVGVVDADIDAPEAWDSQKGSSQIIVAIIDEGVDTQHPDLQSKIVTPYDATDGDNNQEPNSWDGHGTACAGIAVAVTNNNLGVAGVSWNSRILPVRIASSNCQGCGWITTNAIIEDGLRTAVDRGAHVLSNSWGGGPVSNAINSGIDYAIANGRVVVFAAGNGSGPVGYPGNLSTNRVMITVSATNEWDEFKTTTSQDGENWWGSDFGPEINVAAPGVHIYTTDIRGSNGYANGDYVATFNGTSSATPLVAGAAALALSQNPSMTPAEVRDLLQQTADDLGASGFDNQFGHGRLNVGNSFKKVAGKADMVVWRPSDGTWYARLSGGDWNTTISRQWGLGGDIPLANTDFDGDGKADMGVWRPSNGTWYARLSGGDWNSTISRQWGLGGDIPLANTDFDGDGKAEMGVWRPSNGTWYARLSGGDWNTTISRQWGLAGDIPLASTDFDGDAVTSSAAALYIASGTAEGEIAAVNLDIRSFTLIDGSAFTSGEGMSLEDVKPGAEVSVSYEQIAGEWRRRPLRKKKGAGQPEYRRLRATSRRRLVVLNDRTSNRMLAGRSRQQPPPIAALYRVSRKEIIRAPPKLVV